MRVLDVRSALAASLPPRRTGRGADFVRIVRAAVVACAVSVGAVNGHAALSVVGTRFVYPGDARALTIVARNGGAAPILVQAWLDVGDANADPDRLRVPFVVSPPLARLDPAQSLAIRVQSIGADLPVDRESCFWINLLEVPPAAPASDNTLRIAYRLRMKILYRPTALAGDPDQAPNALTWARMDRQDSPSIVATNPTPYYVTLTRVLLHGEPVALASGAAEIAPFSQVRVPIDMPIGVRSGEIVFDAVDDSGASQEYRAQLGP
ncbi:molecular chaperone [Burkholderia sp. Se-20378]|jgi:P pilus assembly chaperone PapD|uniref:fimbrial biogenesis chaperone n=1 Tax=Burkholderia sp. Se-20378 TaxID=2703899 RepID=UPI00197F6B0A|nr:fimbria/pilus periplasmic chaperone [Burkholderia sp. Se-20378]MBN3771580.1 fimbria/pilus periplasmic chaperone [Burkholderia sp. Se-20378]